MLGRVEPLVNEEERRQTRQQPGKNEQTKANSPDVDAGEPGCVGVGADGEDAPPKGVLCRTKPMPSAKARNVANDVGTPAPTYP